MTSLLERLNKRRFYPVKVAGETVHIRLLTDAESREIASLKDELQNAYALGLSLCESEKEPAFPRGVGETPEAYAIRMADLLKDMPQDNVRELQEAYTRLAKVPSLDNLAKN